MRVACCSVARQMLRALGIEVGSHVVRLGEVGLDDPAEWAEQRDALLAEGGARALYLAADQSDVRMLDADLSARTVEHIKATKKAGDTLGGVYEVVATGVPVGLGSYAQGDRRLDGRLAQAILSIQAQKAVEVGDGWLAGRRPGSEIHDPITRDASDGAPRWGRTSNHAGGVEGGISNGQPLVVRGTMKPIPTLIKPLDTADLEDGPGPADAVRAQRRHQRPRPPAPSPRRPSPGRSPSRSWSATAATRSKRCRSASRPTAPGGCRVGAALLRGPPPRCVDCSPIRLIRRCSGLEGVGRVGVWE